jgi:mannose-1-phosphate guanylyltransferase / phosphomannomutase
MAGGEGTRLRPLTYNQPKPMIPMANRALMEHVVALLKRHGFSDVVVTVGFQANAIQNYFGNGAEFGVRMVYASEEAPLGTAGSVRNAMQQLDEPFVVISGDVLTDIDLSAIVDFHNEKKALATMALRSVPNPLEFGIVITREDGTIERFLEKPSWGQVFSDTINAGIYVFEPDIFDFIGPGEVDFSSDVFPRLAADGHMLYGYVTDGYWEDIGTLEAYARAHQDILDGRVAVDMHGFALRKGIWLGEGAEVDPKAEIRGPALIGDYCTVESGATLGEYTVLGRNVRVGADAYVERAVVHDNAYLGPGVRLRGCTIGRRSDLRRGSRIEQGVVVGDECFIGEHAVVRPGVKIYPFKTVEHGAIVNSSIVWESRGARNLFGRTGVSGLANVDISPELAVRLAMAFATTLPRGAAVMVSRDTSRAARVLKQSVVVGLNASGVDVADLEVTTAPVTRFAARSGPLSGGITVRLSADDAQSVTIGFFDAGGTDIPEGAQRKIERIFYREDFRRCLASETGDISHPMRVPDLYAEALLAQVDVDAIRAARFKVVLDYAYGAASFVMPAVLGKLGADVLSVNPYAAAHQSLSFDRWEHARGVSALVKAVGADFGAVLAPDAERLALVDDNGRALTDSEGLLALLSLVLGIAPQNGPQAAAKGEAGSYFGRGSTTKVADEGLPEGGPSPHFAEGPRSEGTSGLRLGSRPQTGTSPRAGPGLVGAAASGHSPGPGAAPGQGLSSVALPVSAPSPAEEMCLRAGAAVIWTKLSASHLMEVASRPGVGFAAGQEGGYIFPRFLPAYDAIAALVHTFALLATTGARLSGVVAGLPRVFSAHEGVVTPWEKKGTVMRAVMELSKDRPTVLVDGVKILHDDGWCLIVPDPEEALTHIWAEAVTEAGALARAQDYARQVRNVLRG